MVGVNTGLQLQRVGQYAQNVAPSGGEKQGSAVGDALRGAIDAVTTDSITADAMKGTVDQALAPFEAPPEGESAVQTATRLVTGALGLLSLPGDLANAGLAMATAGLAKMLPSLPAATLFSPHLGIPHCHTHPPAMPLPLPSLGVILIGGCMSVHVNGVPAARAGDLGIAITCGSLAPPFEVFTGSSKVFFGGSRAARELDITKHCQPSIPGAKVPRIPLGAIAMGAFQVGMGAAGVAGSLSESKQSQAKEAAATVESSKQAVIAAVSGAVADAASSAANAASAEAEAAAEALSQAETPEEAAKAEAAIEKAAEKAQAYAEVAAEAQTASQEAALASASAAADAESMAAMAAGQSLGAAAQAAQTAADAAALVASLLMGKDPGVPPCFGVVVAGHSNVLVGGFPMPPWMALLGGLFKLLGKLKKKVRNKALSDKIHNWINKKMPNKSRFRTLLHKIVCFVTGHPVDVIAGRLLTDAVDFELPGPIPLRFERNYDSAWSARNSPLGYGWSHTLDQSVWLEPGQLVFHAEDGREIEIPLPETFDPADDRDQRLILVFEPFNRLTLRGLGQRRWRITTPEGQHLDFAPVPGDDADRARLVQISDTAGDAILLEYDEAARLAWVVDSGGRRVRFVHDNDDRLVQILLPHPDHEGLITHTRFAYDDAGDLRSITDALGHATRYVYENHKVIQETKPGGLSFYFEYDGWGADAYCVHTWGDGGIYDHRLVYDKGRKTTVVTNSLRETTVYRANEMGAVTEVTDARGAVTRYEYDEHLRKTAEIDPLGHATRFTYDARGNCTQVANPDGATVAVTYEDDLPVAAVDEVGGRWAWSFDEARRLLQRTDPMGRLTTYRYEGRRLAGLTDPGGRTLRFEHDAAGTLTAVHFPDDSVQRWTHDRRGRVVEAIDVRGNVEAYRLDLLGQVVHVSVPDGDRRELTYDPDGNPVRFRSRHRDITMTYSGMRRLATRSEAGTTVGFKYDTEERLLAITNEHGSVYRFERDPTGDLSAEYGFDGIRRLYLHDLAGRVTEVVRASGIRTRYAYNPAGQITETKHSDGSGDRFAYRADGALMEAIHVEKDGEEIPVRFERDLLGRVTREYQGEHWVESLLDEVGFRTEMRSSLGAHQRISRNVMGDVTRVEAVGTGWAVDFEREIGGFEAERRLPGGVRSTWERDKLGRPVQHHVIVEDTRTSAARVLGPDVTTLRSRRYTWDADLRLRQVKDAMQGPIEYTHDERGYLVSAKYPDGKVELRMPDAVGNLFRTEDRIDRKYGPAGQLLAAENEAGETTRYVYDAEGNLVEKVLPDGGRWEYRWNASGMLAEVARPEGNVVRFAYDALGRRGWKVFSGGRTRWLWDRDVPLHEWVEALQDGTQNSGTMPQRATAGHARDHDIHLPLGTLQRQWAECSVTWVVEPGRLIPMARLHSTDVKSIVTDHLGAPIAMLDVDSSPTWSADISPSGQPNGLEGDRHACPFRWPGQYEDSETGLYYNRFRYYDPETGQYTSQDPIGLWGGLGIYQYPQDPLNIADPYGLTPEPVTFDPKDFYSPAKGELNEVKIPMQGSRSRDFSLADKEAGFKTRPTGYTWHHVADFDSNTGMCTMQLVKTNVHESISHSGSVHQFQVHHKVKYDSAEAVDIVHKSGKLKGRKPRKTCGG